ncbi:MAG: hypothetical protein QNJ32_00455 [Xenococcaceae cyanobacterium MO_167.B27]|nr:hypothetical protein [Xenococcaceae cyanobacterium MO_167.B27]
MPVYIGKVVQIASQMRFGLGSKPQLPWLMFSVEYSCSSLSDVDVINLGIPPDNYDSNDLWAILMASLTSDLRILVFTKKRKILYREAEELISGAVIVSPSLSDQARESQFQALIDKYGSKFNS